MIKYFMDIVFMFVISIFLYGQQTYTLTIEIKEVSNCKGNILLGIYNKKEGAFEVKNKFKRQKDLFLKML